MTVKRSVFHLIGIDEAGRGPLAGPVVVAGVKIESRIKNHELWGRKFFDNIKDSKKLTAKQREEWFDKITNYPKIAWAVARIWPKVIDRINISQAANLGALRVYKKLSKATSRQARKIFFEPSREHALLDGGLKLSPHVSYESIIKGDEKIPVISAASIIAKVTRDRIMFRLHKKYPKYHFDVHKGYPTKLHISLIKKFGLCQVHRRSFNTIT